MDNETFLEVITVGQVLPSRSHGIFLILEVMWTIVSMVVWPMFLAIFIRISVGHALTAEIPNRLIRF